MFYFPDYQLRYVKIPKNACSSVILSLGYSVVGDNHPHSFDDVFSRYIEGSEDWPVLVVLRDPYRRLVSAYLNKFTKILPEELFVHELLDYIWRSQRGKQRPDWKRSITFREFVTHVCAFPDEQLNEHWRSQAAFIKGIKPDYYFRTETLSNDWNMHPLFRSIMLRDYIPHRTTSDIHVGSNVLDVPGEVFLGFKEIMGGFPSHRQFEDDALAEQVKIRYGEDCRLITDVL